MAMASSVKVVLGSIAFAVFWVLAVFPLVPFLPIGRTAGSLLGAMLMVLFRVITPDQAYAAIDLPILGLLFGTMVVSVYLERADMFKYLGKLLSWKSRGAKDLLCRVCLISAISSALFTNDTSCVVLTEFVLKIARQHNLPPQPFLLALASSANIGSSATPIGNPQNLVIAVQSKISFGEFVIGILPAMLMGVFVNALILLCMYWRLLSVQKDEEDATAEVVADEDVSSHRFSPATMSHCTSLNSQECNSRLESMNMQGSPDVNGNLGHIEARRSRVSSNENEINSVPNSALDSARNSNASKEVVTAGSSPKREETVPSKMVASMDRLRDALSVQSSEGKENLSTRWKRMLWKSCVYLVTIGMLISLLMGLNMSWTAITAALALVVLDFKDARPCLEKVSYSLLIFFCGMFITVEGFNKTGIPSTLWDLMEPYAQVDHAGGIAVLALVILVLSNVASNVPTVLLLGGQVAASAAAISAADVKKSWLILAWVSTVAGNFSLLGSAANLIVCEQAHRATHLGKNRYASSFGGLVFTLLSASVIVLDCVVTSSSQKMAMASFVKLILGSFAFVIFWVLAVFSAVPVLPIGRTAGSLLGALLMVLFQVLTPEEAYDSIDLAILGLLFGTMVVSVYLERADAFKYLGRLLSWKSKGAKDLLCRICLISAVSSALFTNDTSCMVLTEFVLKVARQHNLPPHPFLLALASSANIGSSATPIGNPQNLVIAIESGISFGEFVAGIFPAALMGVFVNAIILLCMYWNLLSVQKDEEDSDAECIVEESVSFHQFSPATMLHFTSSHSQERSSRLEISTVLSSPYVNGNLAHVETLRNRVSSSESEPHRDHTGALESASNLNASRKWKRVLWKSCVYLVIVGMLISLVMGLNMSWTAITAALALMVLDFKDAMPCLEKVSYSLLIFFCGVFITVQGFNRTGIPNTLWEFMEPYARIDHVSGIAILALVILVLSNLVSNVPTVLLLGGRVAASAAFISPAYEQKAWLFLAWVSTVAGNLSLVGSAANLIVCEQARRAPHLGYTLTFWNHIKFGLPSTLIVTATGLTLISQYS